MNPGNDSDSEEQDKVESLPSDLIPRTENQSRGDQSMFNEEIRNEPYGSEISRGSKKRTARQLGISPILNTGPAKRWKK
jgi:hypothetical protein